ncbi:response regulator [Petrachloros mirabilis]
MGPTDPQQQPKNKPTVLVVDDDSNVLTLCRTILEQAGYEVLAASGSSEALKIVKNHQGQINVLVTDLVLPPPEFSLASSGNEFPHVHGHELALRALRMRQDLHVLLMSSNVDQDLAGSGIRQDALPFLSKPFEPKDLVALVQETHTNPPPTPESLLKENATGPKGADEWFD